MNRLLPELARSAVDLLFPPRCLVCSQPLPVHEPPLFCSACRSRFRWLKSPRCRCCGQPFVVGEDHLCGPCLEHRPPFALARSALIYEPPLSGLITAWKFRGHQAALASLVHLARSSPGFNDLGRPDLILPVPLHPKRLRWRGFNQALQLARCCFPDQRAKIFPHLLCRPRQTVPQTDLSGRERRQNLVGAFSLADPFLVRDRQVLLVDDVWTTGTTVRECGRLLTGAGCRRLEVFTLARRPKVA